MFIEMCDLMNWLVKSLLLTYERRGSQRSLPITGSFFAVLEEGEKIRAVKCRVSLSLPLYGWAEEAEVKIRLYWDRRGIRQKNAKMG